MYKACSRCGKLHPKNYICTKGKVYKGGDDRKLRKTFAWTQKSLEIRERANNLCERCRAQGRYIYEGVEVHHIEKLAEHPELLLEDSNLVCLCQRCHKMADNGEIPKDELRQLVAIREEMDTPPPNF